MRRMKTGVLPSVDVMEPRLLLSTAGPLLSKHALTGVVREVRAIISTLARTEDTLQASAQLNALSSQIPSGSQGLAPSWQSDLGLYRPHSARSIIATENRIVADLDRFIAGGIVASKPPVSASGSTTSSTPTQSTGSTAAPVITPTPTQGTGGTATPVSAPTPVSTPAPAPSLDSVTIQNTTGLELRVTVQLEVPQVQQPTITYTIPAQGNTTACFNFGTGTGDFMTMDVSTVNEGGQGPPPWNDINLSQPMNGYNGFLYTISLFGSYFSVNAN